MSASATFFTMGKILETVQIDSVTSEGDSTANPIENAFDYNLNTHWYPSSIGDQVITLDLNNSLEEKITTLADRDFSSDAGGWEQETMFVFGIIGGSMGFSSNATDQFCWLINAGFGGFVAGRSYRVTYSYGEGTGQTLEFTCNQDATQMLIVSDTDSADGVIDNVSIIDITNEDDHEVDGFGLFIRNYQTHFGVSADFAVEYSDDASVWTPFANKLIESEMTNIVGDPVRLYINGTSQKRRYWRFTFSNMFEIIQLGGLFLLKRRNVDIGNAWPENDRDRFLNAIAKQGTGTPGAIQITRRPVRLIPREWSFSGQANLDAIQGALADSFGSLRPFIYNEGSDYRVVKFLVDDIDPHESNYLLYGPRVVMQELPYIEDGKVI